MKESLFFYKINYTLHEESLCKLEMKSIFKNTPEDKYLFSDYYVDPSRSAFIKQCISIIYTGISLESIVKQILSDNLSSERFKVHFISLEDDNILFEERRKTEYIIGFNINGGADIHNPQIHFGIAKVKDTWIFGKYEENDGTWLIHNKRPYHYSNALSTRVARALVNIAAGSISNCRIVDPCCGIGTVVIEALSMGIDIKGYEINPLIAENAKRNLEFLGYEDRIAHGDMHDIDEFFDVAIVDLPYGLFNPVTLEEQVNIMKTARRIADRMVIITFEDMDQHLAQCGFHVVDKCIVPKKGDFKRYVAVCK
jgi:tRNA (guanine10-N2)-dimethyltransferase